MHFNRLILKSLSQENLVIIVYVSSKVTNDNFEMTLKFDKLQTI